MTNILEIFHNGLAGIGVDAVNAFYALEKNVLVVEERILVHLDDFSELGEILGIDIPWIGHNADCNGLTLDIGIIKIHNVIKSESINL